MVLLKEKAKEQGITQQKLADIAEVTDAHINFILNGKRDISYSLSTRIYKALGFNSPISVILNYYNIKTCDFIEKSFIEIKDITELVGEMIVMYMKKNIILGKKEKEKFIMDIIVIANNLYN